RGDRARRGRREQRGAHAQGPARRARRQQDPRAQLDAGGPGMSTPPANRKLPDAARNKAKVVDAPADPIGDDSPLPGPATPRVRPPSPATAKAARPPRKLGKAARTAQLVAGAAVVLAASISVAWGVRRYLMHSPRFAVRTVLVAGEHRRSAT